GESASAAGGPCGRAGGAAGRWTGRGGTSRSWAPTGGNSDCTSRAGRTPEAGGEFGRPRFIMTAPAESAGGPSGVQPRHLPELRGFVPLLAGPPRPDVPVPAVLAVVRRHRAAGRGRRGDVDSRW